MEPRPDVALTDTQDPRERGLCTNNFYSPLQSTAHELYEYYFCRFFATILQISRITIIVVQCDDENRRARQEP